MSNNTTQKKEKKKIKPRSTSFQAEYITNIILEFLLVGIESSFEMTKELSKYPYYNKMEDLITAENLDVGRRREFDNKFPPIELGKRQVERYRERAKGKISANVLDRGYHKKLVGKALYSIIRKAKKKNNTRDMLAAYKQIIDLYGLSEAKKFDVTGIEIVGSIKDMEKSFEEIDGNDE